MTNEELSAVEAKIRAAVEARIAEGWLIGAGAWFTNIRHCCPMGAVTGLPVKGDPARYAARKLGVHLEFVDSFIMGFDYCAPYPDRDAQAYALGQRLRAEYLGAK